MDQNEKKDFLNSYFESSRSWYIDSIRSNIVIASVSLMLIVLNIMSHLTIINLGKSMRPIKSQIGLVVCLDKDVNDVVSMQKIPSQYSNRKYDISRILIQNYIKQRHEFDDEDTKSNVVRKKIEFVKASSSGGVADDFLAELKGSKSSISKFATDGIECKVDIGDFQFQAASNENWLDKIKNWITSSNSDYIARASFKESCSDGSESNKVAFIKYKFVAKQYASFSNSESQKDLFFLVNEYVVIDMDEEY